MTQAPATPELVERLKGLLVAEDRMHPIGCATWIEETCVTVEEAADALEASRSRITELERTGLFTFNNAIGWQKRAEAAEALADRYEKALRKLDGFLDFGEPAVSDMLIEDPSAINEVFAEIHDLLSSSQGRREGGEL